MKIIGNGVDIVENQRIKISILNKKFIRRICSKSEINDSKNIKNKDVFFAKRFAAKEAIAKSFGTGFRDNLNLRNIEVLNDELGKPYFLKSKMIIDLVNKRFKVKKFDMFLSISDEKDYSIAFTILQIK